MEVCYNVGELLARTSVDGKRDFLLTNRDGSYFYHNLDTKHGGWFVRDQNQLFRVLAEIRIAAPKVSSVVNKFYAVEQHRNKLRELFFVPFKENALVYKTSAAQDIDLVFDVRRASDDTNNGRFYDVIVEDGCTIIRFTKKKSAYALDHEFVFFVAVNAQGTALKRWEKRHYDEDGSDAAVRAVYRAVRFRAKQLVMTAGADRARVLRDNRRVAENLNVIVSAQRTYAGTFAHGPVERAAAHFALDSLTQSLSAPAVSSGVPRLSFISRDELLSVKALMLLGEKKIVGDILFRQLRALQPDGWLPSDSRSNHLRSADASSLLFLRVSECMNLKNLAKEERLLIEKKTVDVIEKLHERHSKNGLAWNSPACTWMDSEERSYAPIEMQALRLALYAFAHAVTKNSIYRAYGEQLKLRVRELFWNGKILADGLADFTQRPNVFLTAYFYPELLSREEWKTCFKSALDCLWLDWGGVSTIDKNQLTSQNDDAGSHHENSWFWINNIAAIVMHRADKKLFKAYVDKIYSASTEELLWKGCVGMPAALSSAKKLTSEGDAAHASSAATFIELCHELKK